MEKKFTFYGRMIAFTIVTIIAVLLNSFTQKTYSQCSSENQRVFFLETFGTGSTPTSNSDVISPALIYQATGPLSDEGVYRTINNTQQKPEWQLSEDHTAGDVDGKMLVINGQAETFYSHRIDFAPGFSSEGTYNVSLYIMNVDTLGLCGPEALLPNMNFRVEYLSSDGTTWLPLSGSPFQAAPVPQTSPSSPTWVELNASFLLPATSFTVTSIRIVLSDGTVGGCGNDFAMDDISLSYCPAGNVTPVTFLDVSAIQKGTGVNVEWSTSQEFNSRSFDVEKSADGNSNWSTIASVNAAGNSAVVKNYSAFDPTPFNGPNFYRIKQFDIDGKYSYSKTVMVKASAIQTAASVLANPFHNSLTVNFSSSTNQIISARLFDITGKQVVMEKWSISPGSTHKEFSNVGALQQGMYILNISNEAGEVIYNNKVIKQ